MTETTENPIRDAITEAIGEHEVILFMKGTPEQPMCGFSARTAAALEALGKPYAAVDVLPDPRIRQELSAISNWPTIPQLFVKGELVGGCDIVTEMYETGELAQVWASRRRATRRPRPPWPPSRARPRCRSTTSSPSFNGGIARGGFGRRGGTVRRASDDRGQDACRRTRWNPPLPSRR